MTPQLSVRAITFAAAAGLLLQPLFGQGRGGTTATPPPSGGVSTGNTGTGTTGRGNLPSTIPNTGQQNPQPQVLQPPIFISGRVMLEDGTAPTETVVIERVCGGQPHAEGYTDSRGYFGIELGQRHAVLQDASEGSSAYDLGSTFPQAGGGFGGGSGSSQNGLSPDMRYMNCDLRARLAGYRSQSVSLANRRSLNNPDIGVILLHRIGATEQGTTVSATSLAAPKDARKAFDKGQAAAKKNKTEEAVKEYTKAVELYPNHALAWCELGKIQAHQGLEEEAHKSFEAALKADPKYMVPYLELAMIEVTAQKWQELADITARAMKLDSFDYPQAYLLNALANYNLQNLGVAELSAREAARLDTRHQYPKSSQLLGLILAQRHDFPGAADEFRNYLKLAPAAADAEKVRLQLDQVEKASADSMPRVAKPDQQ